MVPFARRIVVVLLCCLAALLLVEALLSSNDSPEKHFAMTAVGVNGAGEPINWTMEVNNRGSVLIDGEPASTESVIQALRTVDGELTLNASPTDAMAWEAKVNPRGVTLRGAAAKMKDLENLLYQSGLPTNMTQAVSVADVIAAAERGEIPMPTRSRVSFPEFSYKDAFPGATDEAEIIIESFDQSPWLADLNKIPKAIWKKHYPESLPPVEQRLPENPAVVVGPDGPGQYGGVWRQVRRGSDDLLRKIANESFVKFDPAGRIQPAMAYKWDISPDNRVFTFYLRKGHKWSDGHPFTTADILWVTEDVIGSATWAESPSWMMETDGRSLLYAEDVFDWPGLRDQILAEIADEAPSTGKQLAAVCGDELAALLKQIPNEGMPEVRLTSRIIEMINAALRSAKFFDAGALGSADFDSELNQLREIGFSKLDKTQTRRAVDLLCRNDLFIRASKDVESIGKAELNRLNLAMLRANYAGLVDIGRVKRVKVEAIPDEDGDTSHIIRFTFPRPNSVFLEKTATFLFYRGVFETPKHRNRLLHPAGMKKLAGTDILDPTGLVQAIRNQANQAGDTPGKRLWNLLRDSDRTTFASGTASEQKVIDAINAALTSKDFYSDSAWNDVDFNAAYKEMVGEGFSHLLRNRGHRNLAVQMLVRADLLDRVRTKGISDLTDEERFDFNIMMFRAAFDRYHGPNLVTVNRETGLNVAATQHLRKYNSWTSLYRAQGKYHPELNPHQPTIRAWRGVSEHIEKTVLYVRNPYYYKVDNQGRQLPYIDAIEITKETEQANIALSMSSGNIDFQARCVPWEQFPFLKAKEQAGDYEIRVWANDFVGQINFFCLQAHSDEKLAKLYGDARFRHALSKAINRQEIIDVCYNGLGTPANFAVPKGSPYYNESLATTSVAFDPEGANRLLDEIGLTARDSGGFRLQPDGTSLVINLDAHEAEYPLAALQMVCNYWQAVGVNVQMKIRGWSLRTRMLNMGTLDIGVTKEGGNFYGPLQAGGLAPTHDAEAPQWSMWVRYLRTGGRGGWEAPDFMWEIEQQWNNVIEAPNDEAKFAAWQILAERTAKDLPRIGLMTSPGKLVYVKKNFKNVPKLAIAGWIAHEPSNCCAEAFYFDQGN